MTRRSSAFISCLLALGAVLLLGAPAVGASGPSAAAGPSSATGPSGVVGAVAASPAPKKRCNPCDTTVTGDGSEIDVTVTVGTSDVVPGRGDTSFGEAPGRTAWTTVEEVVVLACSGNTRTNGGDVLCSQAVSCEADDQLRYWVWHRYTEHRLGPPRTADVGEWRREPGSYCLGPDDPGIPDIGRVIASVQTGFASLPLPAFGTQISPAPRTLVNIPTRLEAGQATPIPLSTSPLGIRVQIVATPVSWRWTFGDGKKATTRVPTTEHVYRQAGQVSASVRVTWTGTFTVAGSPETFTINAPAYVQGPPTPVDVRTARSELVDGS